VIATEPLLPLEATPDFNVREPLTPLVSASLLRKVKAPLLVDELYPDDIDTLPPVRSDVPPALITNRPPTP
jgi:hypothetical protein